MLASVDHSCGWDLVLPCLWCRLAAAGPIQPRPRNLCVPHMPALGREHRGEEGEGGRRGLEERGEGRGGEEEGGRGASQDPSLPRPSSLRAWAAPHPQQPHLTAPLPGACSLLLRPCSNLQQGGHLTAGVRPQQQVAQGSGETRAGGDGRAAWREERANAAVPAVCRQA